MLNAFNSIIVYKVYLVFSWEPIGVSILFWGKAHDDGNIGRLIPQADVRG